MKLKTTLLVSSFLAVGAVLSSAATMQISNVSLGPGDSLYQNANNSGLLSTGFVTLGYFAPGITQSQINTIGGLQSVLSNASNYITVTSISVQEFGVPGYAFNPVAASLGTLTTGNALLGRTIYSIVTNQVSLAAFASGSGPTNEIALVNHGAIQDDVPFEFNYTSNPQLPATPVLGTFGSIVITDDSALGNGAYGTLKLTAVPEPSAALLGALGALGLLRRRRN